MLIKKFIVPIIRRFHTDIPQFSFHNGVRNNNVSRKNPQNVKKALIPSKCTEYRDKLAQCPKARKPARQKWQFSQPKPECKIESVVDNYQKAHQEVTDRSKSILNIFQDEAKSALDKLKKDIELSRSTEQKQLEELSDNVKKKVQKLTALNPPFGSFKRKSILLLHYRTQRAFDNLQHDLLPQIRRVQCIINNSERDMLISINRARSLLLSCRKCKNHEALKKCVEENANYAEKILDKTSQKMKLQLDKIDKVQHEILSYHKTVMAKFMKEHRKRHMALMQHLEHCISVIKNKR